MTHTLTRNSPTNITITVDALFDELSSDIQEVVRVIAGEENFPGFRKGMAPFSVVRGRVGEFLIYERAARRFIERTYSLVLKKVEEDDFKDAAFEPVGDPQISITKIAYGEPLRYEIRISLLPSFTLPDYRTLVAQVLKEKKEIVLTSDEIDASKKWLLESRATFSESEAPAEEGDRVHVTFSAATGGAPLPELSSKHHPLLLGKKTFLPGFEEKLIGGKKGDQLTFSLLLPETHPAQHIRGKSVDFAVTIDQVETRSLPLWDDAFAKSVGAFSSISELEAGLESGLKEEKTSEERERLRQKMCEVIAENMVIDIPDLLLQNEIDSMLEVLRSRVEGMGLTWSGYLQHIKEDEDSLRKKLLPDAKKRAVIALTLREIARKEALEPTEEEIKEAISKTIAHRSMTEDDLKKIDHTRFIQYNRGIARNEKVFRLLEGTDTTAK